MGKTYKDKPDKYRKNFDSGKHKKKHHKFNGMNPGTEEDIPVEIDDDNPPPPSYEDYYYLNCERNGQKA